jgi:DNA-binding transcriptional regulator YiaG
MNYGELNLSTIAPSSPVPLAERIRPAWLCITAPEHSQRGISEKDAPDLTPEQIAEAEAEDLRRGTIRALKKQAEAEKREIAKAERQAARDAERAALSRARQIARSAEAHVPTLGESIYAYRILHNLKQEELAERLGCSAPTIGNWEHNLNMPRKGMIEKIAAFLKE